MNRVGFSPPERLIFEVQGLIAEVKNLYFSNDNIPLNDNDIIVHKLCVRLENILRYGAREKYTFMGTKKDYWNYVCESLPKDEVVKFVNSIAELKTNHGKGRALLRQCLMEKCFADTIQRCAINERMTKEYYVTDSIIRHQNHLQTLVHSLYDLNSIDFQIPHKGYDLDRSFPSFSRKTFSETPSRRASVESVRAELDPVIQIHNGISELASIVNTWTGKDVVTIAPNNGNSPTLKENIDKVKIICSYIQNIRDSTSKQIDSLQSDTNKLKDKKLKSDAEYELRLKQLHDRYLSIQKIDTSAATDKFKELYDKLVSTELELKGTRASSAILTEENGKLKSQLEDAVKENKTMLSEKEELLQTVEECQDEIQNHKKCEHYNESTNKILESKLSELQKANTDLKSKEKHLTDQLLSVETTLRMRENDLSILKEAFQQSTGLVVNSFKELKDELNSQLKEKQNHLKEASSLNEELSAESKSLHGAKSELTQRVDTLEEKLQEETKKKEVAEKTVLEFKQRFAEEMKHHNYLQQCITDMWDAINDKLDNDENDDTDGIENVTNLLDSFVMKNKQEKVLKRLKRMKKQLEDAESTSGLYERDVIELNRQSSVANGNIKELTEKLEILEKSSKELQEENEKLSTSDNNHVDDIFNLSTEISKLNEKVVKKGHDYERLTNELADTKTERGQQNEEHRKLKEANDSLLDANKLLEQEVEQLERHIKEMKESYELLLKETERYDAKELSHMKEVKTMKQEVESVVSIKNQEMQSLKFELSTLEMKHESILNELKGAEMAKETLTNELVERDERIEELEKNGFMASEKEALTKERDMFKKQVDEAKGKCAVTDKEITFLKVQLAKLAKEKDEEKATRVNTSNRLNNLIEERKAVESNYKEEIDLLNEDLRELKLHLVNVTKDKHELWQQKDSLEFEMRQKADERWVKDDEVNKCTTCLGEFSLVQRKHHCRLCGQIFCHSCSNRWLKTAHSKKKIRACNVCADTYSEKHGDKRVDQEDLHKAQPDSYSTADTMSIASQYESFDASRQLSSGEDNHGGNDDNHAGNYDNHGNDDDDDNDNDSSQGNFEVLDSSKMSRSGTFDASEKITLQSSDIRIENLQPKIIVKEKTLSSQHTGDDDEPAEHLSEEQSVSDENVTTREKIDLTIAAGKRCFLPIVVPEKYLELTWEFTSSPKDVGFGIAYKTSEQQSDEELDTIIPFSRYISHKQSIHGKMTIENEGIYYLCFSNAYSKFTTKTVACFISINQYTNITDNAT